jgi:hypothetical protein
MVLVRGNERRAPRRVLLVGALVAVGLVASGCVTDLTDELGESATVAAINDAGDTAGSASILSDARNMRYDQEAPGVPLPDPDEGAARVVDINNSREVLGTVTASDA